jgi:hypothetical protein
MFLGIPTHPIGPLVPVLRVATIRDIDFSSPEGTVRIPGHHTRLSIWPEDRPVCAMSLSEEEAKRLGRFLLSAVSQAPANEPRGMEAERNATSRGIRLADELACPPEVGAPSAPTAFRRRTHGDGSMTTFALA